MNTILVFLRYPAPPAASSAYGQPPQPAYNSMAPAAPPPTQHLTNQMGAMNLGNYGELFFTHLYLLTDMHTYGKCCLKLLTIIKLLLWHLDDMFPIKISFCNIHIRAFFSSLDRFSEK